MNANVSKTNGVKLLAAVAVLAMVVCIFTAVMPADQAEAATNSDPLYISGTIDESTPYENGNTVIVDRELTITGENTVVTISGESTFTINEGVTVTIQNGASLIIESTAGDVTVNGDIVVNGSRSVFAIAKTFDNSTHKGGVVVNSTGSITAERGGWIASSDIGIIGNTVGSIVLKSGASLDITKTSSNVSMIRSIDVVMYDGSTFNVNGYFKNVLVRGMGDAAYYTAGAVYLDHPTDGDVDFTSLNNRTTSDLSFTVTTQTAPAYLDDETNADRVTLRQYVLDVSGTIDGYMINEVSTYDRVTFLNADTLTSNGYSDSAWNGAAKSGNTYSNQTFYVADENGADGYVALTSISGTLNVSENGHIWIGADAHVDISGTLNISYDSRDQIGDNNTVFNGYLHITGTVTLDDANLRGNGANSTFYIDGGSMDIYNADIEDTKYASRNIYGAAYIDDSDRNNEILKIRDLDVAITDATAIEADVHVFGLKNSSSSESLADSEEAEKAGAYIIDTDLTIPDNMILYYHNGVFVSSTSTVTFVDGSEAEPSNGIIYVDGKVVDQSGTFDYNGVESVLKFEVKKTSEDGSEATYTTLSIAISEAVAGESIELNGTVVVSENLVIPDQVTVVSDDSDTVTNGLDIRDATLTVNGILDMKGKTIIFSDGNDTGSSIDGTIVVNNYIVNVATVNMATSSADPATGSIAGAHFVAEIDDYDESNIIASVSVAAENSASADSTSGIVIYGNVNMGDVTFTAAQDDTLTIYIRNAGIVTGGTSEVARAGTVTLNGGVSLNTYNRDFTGTIAGADASMSFTNNRDMIISVAVDESQETATYQMTISSKTSSSTDGIATVVSGTVMIDETFSIGKITINDGAEILVPRDSTLDATGNPDYRLNTLSKELPLVTESLFEQIAGLIVNGTLTVENGGNLSAMIAVINGTVTAGSTSGTMDLDYSYINGTLDVADNANVGYQLMIVAGIVNGAVEGDTTISGLMAYPGADISQAQISYNGTTETQAEITTYYVNGTEYATVYALGNVPIDAIALFIDVPGYDTDTASFYSDEGMRSLLSDVSVASSGNNQSINSAIDLMNPSATPTDDTMAAIFMAIGLDDVFDALSNYLVGDYPEIYVSMDPSTVTGTITTYNGLSIYIDGLSLSNIPYNDNTGRFSLDVGSHTIEVQISPAYTGTYEVTLNGQAVTGNTFEITGDMTEFQIVVTGNLTQQSVVVDGGNGGSDMGLTDYLLIILVVLIVIMAIMVAMRLMRS